ncbi:homeobox-leucine zipper protein HOX11 [Cajanus cajan]|uniref:Homeobox-leucine zipper protein HOX27 n=1 Tax=Cajanus cajan TaxID=3821 RepID=A0A151SWW6_CAJCA|nr:homeobox-leucine zipper protein HOX11 [Cajanus cajan]KYP59269.1 Homeobox-leucine zipper protein HOX27 [Cajanus cajan]
MELGLSLGDSSRPLLGFMEKPREASNQLGLGFNTTLSIGPIITRQKDHEDQELEEEEEEETKPKKHKNNINNLTTEDPNDLSSKPNNNNPVLHQLDLLPQLSFPWHPPSENGSLSSDLGGSSRGLDVNAQPAAAEEEAEEAAALSSSPNSAASSFQMDLCIYSNRGGSFYKRDSEGEAYDQRASSRASDEDDTNGGPANTRKKLRLSKEQSAFLEESFKEHNTLNPKQKLALAKQLNLRPRQVEVWFQNRRARTKLKQTEVDCEYLKRCCETLTEENRRLHKELQELRALKTSNPFYMQLPATTLTMCPSCERVATNSTTTSSSLGATINANSGTMASVKTSNNNNTITNDSNSNSNSKAIGFPFGKPRFHPFVHASQQSHQHQSPAS